MNKLLTDNTKFEKSEKKSEEKIRALLNRLKDGKKPPLSYTSPSRDSIPSGKDS